MKSWIAHEHDETGRPTESCLIVSAHTQTEARQLMSSAITAHSTIATRQQRDRLYAIFIEAPKSSQPRTRDNSSSPIPPRQPSSASTRTPQTEADRHLAAKPVKWRALGDRSLSVGALRQRTRRGRPPNDRKSDLRPRLPAAPNAAGLGSAGERTAGYEPAPPNVALRSAHCS
jgi:hypothetical protein